jgi:DNA-directed RNA polymerase specialized sigma24 family protein
MKSATSTKTEYATASDFCSMFEKQMASLYQLAFLLAADHDVAQRIFEGALEECRNATSVFRGQAGLWAKRAVVLNAIRLIAPRPSHAPLTEDCEQEYDWESPLDTPEEAIAQLSPFTRFVFLMNVLEKFSVAECAVLLRSTRENVIQTRTQALLATSFQKRLKNQPEFTRASTVLSADCSQPAHSDWDRSHPQFREICA